MVGGSPAFARNHRFCYDVEGMRREYVQFETALLLSLALHAAFFATWQQREMLSHAPLIGAVVKVLTPPAKSPLVFAKAPTAVEPVITFVEQKVEREETVSQTAAVTEAAPPAPPPPARPKRFIETDDSQVSGEKPKETDLYSDRATVAANPKNPSGKIGDTPYLDGTETRMLSTEDVVPKLVPSGPPSPPRPAAPAASASAMAPLVPPTPPAPAPSLKPVDLPPRLAGEPKAQSQPSVEAKRTGEARPAHQPAQPKLEPKKSQPAQKAKPLPEAGLKSEPEAPKPAPEPGPEPKPETQLAMVTPTETPKIESLPASTPLPTPAQDMPASKPELSLPQAPPAPAVGPSAPSVAGGGAGGGSEREIGARKSRLTSVGVTRLGVAAFNVAESPFGAYDKAIVRAVQSRWYALIEENRLYERAGEVTIHFQLLPDGTVTNAEVKSTTAGEILALFCQKAIVESAPFAPWPEELRAYLGSEPREVDFTFYY